jgi:hypothetical protein
MHSMLTLTQLSVNYPQQMANNLALKFLTLFGLSVEHY